jgi:hypothetical protein
MAGLVPAIDVLLASKAWMPATSAGMTARGLTALVNPTPRTAIRLAFVPQP